VCATRLLVTLASRPGPDEPATAPFLFSCLSLFLRFYGQARGRIGGGSWAKRDLEALCRTDGEAAEAVAYHASKCCSDGASACERFHDREL